MRDPAQCVEIGNQSVEVGQRLAELLAPSGAALGQRAECLVETGSTYCNGGDVCHLRSRMGEPAVSVPTGLMCSSSAHCW